MWKKIAEAYGFAIPTEQIERIAPALDALHEQVRPALDGDLSRIDPVAVFRPAPEPRQGRTSEAAPPR